VTYAHYVSNAAVKPRMPIDSPVLRPQSHPQLTPMAVIGASAALGTSVATSPTGVVAFLTASALLLMPATAVAAGLALELLRLPLVLSGAPSTLLYVAETLLFVLSCVSLSFLRKLSLQSVVVASLVVGVVAGPGILVALLSEPLPAVAASTNLITLPVIALTAGRALGAKRLAYVYKITTILMLANAVAGVLEVRTGTNGLVAQGLQYGKYVRNIGDLLRAPALMNGSVAAGLTASALLIWTIAELVRPSLGLRPRWIYLAIPACSLVLLLSTSRSAMVMLSIFVFAVGLSRGKSTSLKNRLIAFLLIVAMAVGFVVYGAGNNKSLFERIPVWQGLLVNSFSWFGKGLGSVGGATQSSFSPFPTTFVDNYWLSVYLQLGLVSLMVLFVLWVAALVALRRPHGDMRDGMLVGAIVFSIGTTAMLIEIWEYSGAMILLGLVVGNSLRLRAHPNDNSVA
jgi:hypothetical protein